MVLLRFDAERIMRSDYFKYRTAWFAPLSYYLLVLLGNELELWETTLEASALKWAVEIAASPREGLASTKQIVAAIRAGGPGTEPRSYGAALKTSPAARARIEAFSRRQRPT